MSLLRDLILARRLRRRRTPAGEPHAGARPRRVAHDRDRGLRSADRRRASSIARRRRHLRQSRALDAERPRPPAEAAAKPEAKPPQLSQRDGALGRALRRTGATALVARAFTTALPAFDAFPMAQWARLSAKHWRRSRSDVMGYGEPFGHPPLRQAIAAHLRANRGIGCDAEQIFIVGGAQQAFSLIGSVLLDPGDSVWFENPGAIGARNSLIAAGAELVPVPVDEQGTARRGGPAPRAALPPRLRHALAPAAARRGDEPGARASRCCTPPSARAPGSSRTTTTASSFSAARRCRRSRASTPPGS